MSNLLKAGLHPDASDALRKAGVPADMIGQTIGNAPASGGTHAKDGKTNGNDYCSATDLRIHTLSHAAKDDLFNRVANQGFAVFYRKPGENHWPESEVEHVHLVWPGAKMKQSLRTQLHNYCHTPMLNGLASHVPYVGFWEPTKAQQQIARGLFLASGNPVTG